MLCLKDGKRRAYVSVSSFLRIQRRPSEKNGTFLVSNLCHIEGFRVTARSQDVNRKMRRHIHIIILLSRVFCFSSFSPKKFFRLLFLTMILTELIHKDKHTHTHVDVYRELLKYWKKYEIIKILDVWYWFLLIFHYEAGVWVKFSVFCQCVFFFFLLQGMGQKMREKYFNFLCS